MQYCPVARLYNQQRKSKIYDDGSNGKKDINGCMFPFVVPEAEQGYYTFYHPEKSNTAREYQCAVKAGDMFKITDNTFDHG
jgi:hypothetical protein